MVVTIIVTTTLGTTQDKRGIVGDIRNNLVGKNTTSDLDCSKNYDLKI